MLSPVVNLGTIGRSRSLVSESQESLDPGDHSDVEDEPHPQDADDEDDTGLVSLNWHYMFYFNPINN